MLRRDLRLALRRIIRAPVFSGFAIGTLAIALTAMVVIHASIGALLGWDYRTNSAGVVQLAGTVSLVEFRDVASRHTGLVDAAAVGAFPSAIAGDGVGELLTVEAIAGRYFEAFDVQPVRGRLLSPDDERQRRQVVVLSERWWTTRYGRREDLVGNSVRLAGGDFVVIGVLPSRFIGIGPWPRVAGAWIPATAAPAALDGMVSTNVPLDDRRWLHFIATTRPETSRENVRSQFLGLGAAWDAGLPEPDRARASARWNLNEDLGRIESQSASIMRTLMVVPILVFAIACTNIGNLVLSKGISRRGDLATRRAVGASRWQVMRAELVEAVLLLAAGLGIGLLASEGALRIVSRELSALIDMAAPGAGADAHIGVPTLLVAVFGALVATVVAAIVPAWHATRGDDIGRTIATRSRWRGRGNLIAVQVALSAILGLVTAASASRLGGDALLAQALASQTALDGLAAVAVPFAAQQYAGERAQGVVQEVLSQSQSVLGQDVAAAAGIPIFEHRLRTYRSARIARAPFSQNAPDSSVSAGISFVSARALELTGTRVTAGRGIQATDEIGSEPVVLISTALSERLFGRPDAVGQPVHLVISAPGRGATGPVRNAQVVGVTGDRGERVYVPLAQEYDPNIIFLARAADGRPPVGALESIVRKTDPSLGILFAAGGRIAGSQALLILSSIIWMMWAAVAVTLVLSMSGLYGVVSQVMHERRKEMAVRAVLGASAIRLLSMTLREGLRPVVEGLSVAVVVAILLIGVLRSSNLIAVSAVDIRDVLVLGLAILLAGAASCWGPARKASRANLNVELKAQ